MKLLLISTLALSVFAGTKLPFPQPSVYSLIQSEYSQSRVIATNMTLSNCILMQEHFVNSSCVKTKKAKQK
jgi:hypothetical protein